MTPAGLNPGDRFRMVFVTTTTTTATSTALSTYDGIATAAAVAGGLGTYGSNAVTWEAIGRHGRFRERDNPTPRGQHVPIFLPDGTEVVSSGAALWNTVAANLLHGIDETATGVLPPEADVWTGTRASGIGLSGATLGGPQVSIGTAGLGFTAWVRNQLVPLAPPDVELPLYGFSAVLTVPQTHAVPEPSSLTLLVVGIAGFVGTHLARRRREALSRRERLEGSPYDLGFSNPESLVPQIL